MECRILEKGQCEITQEYNSKHLANDIVGGGYTIDNVVAHSDGIVVFCQTGQANNPGSTGNASYGNCVKIKHNNGMFTLYAHLDTVSVELNQQVTKGQLIGRMGNTGNSYGAHTHFEVRDNNDNRINPTLYLNADLPNTSSNVDYTGVITYQAYTNKWLPEVNKCDETDEGYAGLYNIPMTGIKAKPQFGEITIQAHTLNGVWLKPVNSNDYYAGNCNSYAGILGTPMDAIIIKSTKGYVEYQVCTIEDGWLPMVDSRTNEGSESYAGIFGHTIVGIRMK